MMKNVMTMFGLGMSLIAFNPVLAFAGERGAAVPEKYQQQYEIELLGFEEDTLVGYLGDYELRLNKNDHSFTYVVEENIYGGTIDTRVNPAEKFGMALVTFDTGEQHQVTFETSSDNPEIISIKVIDEAGKLTQIEINPNERKLVVTGVTAAQETQREAKLILMIVALVAAVLVIWDGAALIEAAGNMDCTGGWFSRCYNGCGCW